MQIWLPLPTPNFLSFLSGTSFAYTMDIFPNVILHASFIILFMSILFLLCALVWIDLSLNSLIYPGTSQMVLVVKNPPANAGDVKRCGFNFWVGKIPWRRACQTTLVFWPGESHGQRSLVGYSPQGCKELDTLKQLSIHAYILYILLISLWDKSISDITFCNSKISIWAFF